MGAAVVVRVRVKAILCVIVDGVPNALRRFHVPVHVRNMHAYTSVVNPRGCDQRWYLDATFSYGIARVLHN